MILVQRHRLQTSIASNVISFIRYPKHIIPKSILNITPRYKRVLLYIHKPYMHMLYFTTHLYNLHFYRVKQIHIVLVAKFRILLLMFMYLTRGHTCTCCIPILN